MTAKQRLAECFELNKAYQEYLKAEIRTEHPGLSEVEFQIEMIRRMHGEEIVKEVGPHLRNRAAE